MLLCFLCCSCAFAKTKSISLQKLAEPSIACYKCIRAIYSFDNFSCLRLNHFTTYTKTLSTLCLNPSNHLLFHGVMHDVPTTSSQLHRFLKGTIKLVFSFTSFADTFGIDIENLAALVLGVVLINSMAFSFFWTE